MAHSSSAKAMTLSAQLLRNVEKSAVEFCGKPERKTAIDVIIGETGETGFRKVISEALREAAEHRKSHKISATSTNNGEHVSSSVSQQLVMTNCIQAWTGPEQPGQAYSIVNLNSTHEFRTLSHGHSHATAAGISSAFRVAILKTIMRIYFKRHWSEVEDHFKNVVLSRLSDATINNIVNKNIEMQSALILWRWFHSSIKKSWVTWHTRRIHRYIAKDKREWFGFNKEHAKTYIFNLDIYAPFKNYGTLTRSDRYTLEGEFLDECIKNYKEHWNIRKQGITEDTIFDRMVVALDKSFADEQFCNHLKTIASVKAVLPKVLLYEHILNSQDQHSQS